MACEGDLQTFENSKKQQVTTAGISILAPQDTTTTLCGFRLSQLSFEKKKFQQIKQFVALKTRTISVTILYKISIVPGVFNWMKWKESFYFPKI